VILFHSRRGKPIVFRLSRVSTYQRKRLTWAMRALGAVALLAGLAMSTAEATAATGLPRYAVTALPTLGGNFSSAGSINDTGWIVGDANLSGNSHEHATLWRNGVITDLGTLGGPDSFGIAANSAGLIGGTAQIRRVDPLGEGWGALNSCTPTGTPCDGSQYLERAFVWTGGRIRRLPTLGGNNGVAFAGPNDAGEIVGWAETAHKDSSCQPPQVLDWEAAVWGPNYGEIHALPPFPGDRVAAATAVNDEGQVVGGSGTCGFPATSDLQHAVLWQRGAVIYLGSLGGTMNNLAFAINNRGQVVGQSDLPGDMTAHAFLWQNGVMTDLGTLPGDSSSSASAINDQGQVVGSSCDTNGNCRAFLWQHGVMTDLNTLAVPSGSFNLLNAGGINAGGEIAGQAVEQSTGETLAVSAIPCDTLPAGSQACNAGDQSPIGAGTSKVGLPESVREHPRLQLRLGRASGVG
jgi:probable HAF family extracellular repeat protein